MNKNGLFFLYLNHSRLRGMVTSLRVKGRVWVERVSADEGR